MAAYKQRWTDLFTLLDANKNGQIEKADVAGTMKIFRSYKKFNDAQIASFKAALEELLTGAIKTGGGADQKVSLNEWIAIAEKHFIGKKFAEAPVWYKHSVASIFEAIDKDNNGVINEDEFVAIVTGMVPSVSVDIAKAAFKQVQGKLDKAAFQHTGWDWITGTAAVPQDVILTLAVSQYNN